MEAIGDLPRLRRAFASALSERATAITTDDLDFGMLLEPIRCSRRGAIRQYVDYLAPFQVHDDGPIGGPLAPSPIINPDHPNACIGAPRFCLTLEMAQDRIVARRHANALHQAFAWSAANAVAKKMKQFGGAPRPAREGSDDFRQPLDKRLSLTRLVATAPTPHAQLQRHARSLCRQVLKMTLMPAVPMG
jgi:hypothetical protein